MGVKGPGPGPNFFFFSFIYFIFFKYYLPSFLEKRKKEKENREESSLLLRVCLARGYTFLIKAIFLFLKKYYLITNLVLIFKNK